MKNVFVIVELPIEDVVEEFVSMSSSEVYEERKLKFRLFDMVQYESALENVLDTAFDHVTRLTRLGVPTSISEVRQNDDAYDAFRKARNKKKWLKTILNMPKKSESEFVFVSKNQIVIPESLSPDIRREVENTHGKVYLPCEYVCPKDLKVNKEKFKFGIEKEYVDTIIALYKKDLERPEMEEKQKNTKKIFVGTDFYPYLKALENFIPAAKPTNTKEE